MLLNAFSDDSGPAAMHTGAAACISPPILLVIVATALTMATVNIRGLRFPC